MSDVRVTKNNISKKKSCGMLFFKLKEVCVILNLSSVVNLQRERERTTDII